MKSMRFSKNTKLLSVTSFLTDISSEMILPLLPFFLTQVLLAPAFVVGIIEGLMVFSTKVSGFFSGLYTDKTGKKKRMIILGYSLSTAMKAFLAVANNWIHVLIVMFLERAGKGIRGAPRDALIRISETDDNLGKAFGLRKTLDNAGAVLGPMLATFLLAIFALSSIETTYRFIFAVALIPAIIAVIILFFIEDKTSRPQHEKIIIKSVLEAKNIKKFFVVMFIFALGNFAIAFFLLRSNQYISILLIPVAYLMYNVFFTIFAIPAGYITDKLGAKFALNIGQLFFLLSLFGFMFFASSLAVFFFMILLGIFMAFYETSPRVLIAKVVDKKYYASGIGTYNALIGIAALPANLIAGQLWNVQVFSLPAAFVFSLFTTILSLILLNLFVKE